MYILLVQDEQSGTRTVNVSESEAAAHKALESFMRREPWFKGDAMIAHVVLLMPIPQDAPQQKTPWTIGI